MHIEKFKYYYYINTKLALFVIKTDTQSIYYQTRLRLALEFRVCRDYSQFSIENPSAMCCELSSKNQHARRQQPFTIVLTARKKNASPEGCRKICGHCCNGSETYVARPNMTKDFSSGAFDAHTHTLRAGF